MIKKIILTLFIFCFTISTSMAKRNEDEIKVIHKKTGTYVFVIDMKQAVTRVKPVVDYMTVNELYEKGDYDLVVNGGFFNMKTGVSASFVTIDGVKIEDISKNLGFMESLSKDNRLEAVLNRAEFRILEKENPFFENRNFYKFDIANHFDCPPEGYQIKHALQAGPMLLPKMNLENESFVKTNGNGKVVFEAADVLKRRERTILGIKKNKLYIVIFTSRNKVSLKEARNFCKKMRFKKAMALDGGGSTSINYKGMKIYSENKTQRKVKSFLTVEKKGCEKIEIEPQVETNKTSEIEGNIPCEK